MVVNVAVPNKLCPVKLILSLLTSPCILKTVGLASRAAEPLILPCNVPVNVPEKFPTKESAYIFLKDAVLDPISNIPVVDGKITEPGDSNPVAGSSVFKYSLPLIVASLPILIFLVTESPPVVLILPVVNDVVSVVLVTDTSPLEVNVPATSKVAVGAVLFDPIPTLDNAFICNTVTGILLLFNLKSTLSPLDFEYKTVLVPSLPILKLELLPMVKPPSARIVNGKLLVLDVSDLKKFVDGIETPVTNNASALLAVPHILDKLVVLAESTELRLSPWLMVVNPTIVDFGVNVSLLIIAN